MKASEARKLTNNKDYSKDCHILQIFNKIKRNARRGKSSITYPGIAMSKIKFLKDLGYVVNIHGNTRGYYIKIFW